MKSGHVLPPLLHHYSLNKFSLGVELLGLIFAGYMLLASQRPYPSIIYSVAN